MTTGPGPAFDPLRRDVAETHARFLDELEPHRPALYRYARALTGSVWDAEDLAQEALTRAFAQLALSHREIRDPRRWLLRVATHAWVDTVRRQRPRLATPELEEAGADPRPESLGPEVREALETVASALPPRERVALLLKEAFGFPVADIALALGTTAGAVKSALHRGRRRLAVARPPAAPARGGPDAGLVDRFVEAFNARDVERLVALMAPGVRTRIVGCYEESGPDATRGVFGHTFADPTLLRAERIEWEGEAAVALLYRTADGEAVGDLVRLRTENGQVTEDRWSYFSPESLREVAAALGRPARTWGYRYRAG